MGFALLLTPMACDGLLDVELPTRVPAEVLDDPALATLLVNSAIADFECAFANYIGATGVMTDEFQGATSRAAQANWYRRHFPAAESGTVGCTPEEGWGVYRPLQTARYQAEDAFRRISEASPEDVPGREGLLARAATYAGLSLTLLGEGYCQMALDEGPAMAPSAVLDLAAARFTEGISRAQAANDSDIENLARSARARVLLNLGRDQEAAQDALAIPEDYEWFATYSSASTRRENLVFKQNVETIRVSVDPRYRDLTVEGEPDSRVPAVDAGRTGHDAETPLWLSGKYTAANSPIRIASWEEAQLILAEINGGADAVDRINLIRVKHGLPTYSETDPVEIGQQVIEERRRTFFLEGRRFNDMLRLDLDFDSGLDHVGIPFGTATCIPLPPAEVDNNPNLGG